MARFSALVTALLLSSASAFAPQPVSSRQGTSLQASKNDLKKAATSIFAGAVLMGNLIGGADAVFAASDYDFGGSSQVIAGRSGGRGGGRVSRGTSNSYKARAPAPTRTIERTTVIQSPSYASPVYIAPPVYNPMGGLGLGLGLSAVNDIGNTMRDMRQENEIQQGKQELQQARMKEAELEGRLRQLEMQSAVAR